MNNMGFSLFRGGRKVFFSVFSLSGLVLAAMFLHLFSSCSHSDYYYDTDEAPVLSVSRNGRSFGLGTILTDSVKVGYSVSYGFRCSDTHLVDPDVFLSDVDDICDFHVGEKEFSLLIKREGVARGVVVGRDIYGRESRIGFSVTAFANKPPLAKCEVTKVGNLGQYEICIDMSSSKDGDAEFGGELVMYEYSITSSDGNVYNVQTELSKISYIFAAGGLEKVQCRVCDSDGVWSDWISEYVEF